MVDKDCKCTSCKCGDMTMDELVSNINDQTKPFIEEAFEGYVIRTFDPSYPDHLYKWHSDPEDRVIEVLEDSDWRFQYDNELPTPLITGVDIKIPKGTIHRIIKGTNILKIKIYKSY
tara:strand:- start:1368 stop:1718 length:351 start_codon:yes stop_codon:yes gene_type:complete